MHLQQHTTSTPRYVHITTSRRFNSAPAPRPRHARLGVFSSISYRPALTHQSIVDCIFCHEMTLATALDRSCASTDSTLQSRL